MNFDIDITGMHIYTPWLLHQYVGTLACLTLTRLPLTFIYDHYNCKSPEIGFEDGICSEFAVKKTGGLGTRLSKSNQTDVPERHGNQHLHLNKGDTEELISLPFSLSLKPQ